MSLDHRVFSTTFNNNNIVQQVAVQQPKSLLIDTLRELFRGDSEYPYVSDAFGYPVIPDVPNTPDLDPLPYGEGGASAIIIRDTFADEAKMLPAIVVSHRGGKYMPISMSQNEGTLSYDINCFLDENGFPKYTRVPKAHIFAGAWDMTFDVRIDAEDILTLEELSDIVSVHLQHTARDILRDNGLFIKSLSFSGESEEPYANDYVHTQTLTLETYSEWRREIPISNIIETVVFSIGCQHFGGIDFPSNPRTLAHIAGRNIVGNHLDIITIAGKLDGVSTEDLILSNTEQDIFQQFV